MSCTSEGSMESQANANLKLEFLKFFLFIFCCITIPSARADFLSVKQLYDGCGKNYSCLGNPDSDCTKTKSCEYAAVIRKEHAHDLFIFTLFFTKSLSTSMYVAGGFGGSAKMIKLVVFECTLLDGHNQPTGHTSTTGESKKAPTRIDHANPSIQIIDGRTDMKYYICEFTLPPKFKIGDLSIDFNRTKYFLSICKGKVNPDGGLMHHTEKKVSENSIDFNKATQIKGKDATNRSAGKIHGILMVIAYMFLMPIGRLVGRYFKETWTGTTIMKRKLWFLIHVGMMNLSALLILAAYLVITITNGHLWPFEISDSANYHAVVGTISMVCLFLQVTIPWVVPQSRLTLKLVYYKFHFVIGGITYALGLTNIIMASWWVHQFQPCEAAIFGFIWISFDISFTVIFTVISIFADSTTEDIPLFRSLVNYPFKKYQVEEAPYKNPRVVVLILLIVCSASITIGMSVIMIIFKPCVDYPATEC